MNLNKLAKRITLKEGKKKQVSIAQVKEILKLTLEDLARAPQKDVERVLNRYRKKKR